MVESAVEEVRFEVEVVYADSPSNNTKDDLSKIAVLSRFPDFKDYIGDPEFEHLSWTIGTTRTTIKKIY